MQKGATTNDIVMPFKDHYKKFTPFDQQRLATFIQLMKSEMSEEDTSRMVVFFNYLKRRYKVKEALQLKVD